MTRSFTIREPRYFSYLDEKSFFSWLNSIDDVARVTGSLDGLQVHIVDSCLSRRGLSDLIAVLVRYSVDIRPIHDVVSDDDRSWFFESDSYWQRTSSAVG